MADEKKNRFGPDPFFCPASSRDWDKYEDEEQEDGGSTIYINRKK